MTDYGTDVSTFVDPEGDLDPYFGLIAGPRVVAEAVARRLCTPAGSLDDDRDAGLDLLTFLNLPSSVSTSEIASMVQIECEKDERVYAADVRAVRSGEALSLTVALTLVDSSQFSLVFDISGADISTTILGAPNG